jgi:hypothetical protein
MASSPDQNKVLKAETATDTALSLQKLLEKQPPDQNKVLKAETATDTALSLQKLLEKQLQDEIFQNSTWKRRAMALEVEMESMKSAQRKEKDKRTEHEALLRELSALKAQMEILKADTQVFLLWLLVS